MDRVSWPALILYANTALQIWFHDEYVRHPTLHSFANGSWGFRSNVSGKKIKVANQKNGPGAGACAGATWTTTPDSQGMKIELDYDSFIAISFRADARIRRDVLPSLLDQEAGGSSPAFRTTM